MLKKHLYYWLEIVMVVLGIANQSALFQHSYTTLKLLMTSALGSDVINS